MELISFSGGNSKVNFFEKRNADYMKISKKEDQDLTFEEDFWNHFHYCISSQVI